MARRVNWFDGLSLTKLCSQQVSGRQALDWRRLRTEPLEDRRMLAAVTVDNDLDLVNGDTSSIAALIASDGGDGIALREALEAANNTIGADTIDFDASLSGGTIDLLGQLAVSDAVTIDATALAGGLTIDAGNGTDNTPGTRDGFRIFNIDDSNGGNQINVAISRLTLTGGDTSGYGGAIFNSENLTVTGSTLSGNSGRFAGGGIYNGGNGTVNVANSTLSGNSAESGGGIFNSGTVTITNSTLSGNSGTFAGGGIYNGSNGTVNVTNSTLSGNSTSYWGGGIYNGGNATGTGTVTITNSTLSGNSAGYSGSGGGILNRGTVTIANSTLSGNSAGHYGGGIININADVTITNSTLSGNSATIYGGGISSNGGYAVLNHTIVANNTAPLGPDIRHIVYADWSLIENTDGVLIGGANNVTGLDPLLGPLANNGGLTLTHALLAGSPAIDAGDPAFVPPPNLDQRGYYRRVDGDGDMAARIDIGAFEYASVAPLPGDGNLDQVVDGLDYLIWAGNYNDNPADDPPGSPKNGDYNNDGRVDGLDYLVWAGNYGTSFPVLPAAQTFGSVTSTPSQQELAAVDLALQDDYDTGANASHDPSIRDWWSARTFDSVLDKLVGKRRDHKRVGAMR